MPNPGTLICPRRVAIEGMAESETAHLSLLEPNGVYSDADLLQLYHYPDVSGRAWVRANVIAGLDGAAAADGTSGALGSAGDKHIFDLLRALADVILVGAGTVRSEAYSGCQIEPARRRQRGERGQTEVPPIAIVTRAGLLDPELPVFTSTAVPPLVLTCTAAADDTRRRLGRLAEVIDCSDTDPADLDHATLLAQLQTRGLRRILTEGGPTLLGSLIDADLLDDLCLTLAPLLVGGSGGRISSGTREVLTRMRRAHVLTDADGYLYTRYVKT